MKRVLALAVGSSLPVAFALSSEDARADTLRFGTTAPQTSPAGQVLKVWARQVQTESPGGGVTLDWQWSGAAGDDAQMIASMRAGQLDGAALAGIGLGAIDRDLLALEMPGLFATPQKFAAALKELTPYFRERLAKRGFVLVGWIDGGQAHVMSTGFVVRTPSDAGKGKYAYVAQDPIAAALAAAIGGSSVALSVQEIFPSLGSGAAQEVNAPSLDAEQMQWSSRITDVDTLTTGYWYGALVMPKARFDKLAPDAQRVVHETGASAMAQLSARIDSLDAQAFANLKNTKAVYAPSDADKTAWAAAFAKARAALRGAPNGITTETFDKVTALAAK